MDRRTQEKKEGKPSKPFRKPAAADRMKTKRGLEDLGQAKHLQAELQRMAGGKRIRPGLKRLRPEDLPAGVRAVRSYDHRGHSLTFEHETLGELGRIVLTGLRDGQTLIQSEFCLGQDAPDSPLAQKKKAAL